MIFIPFRKKRLPLEAPKGVRLLMASDEPVAVPTVFAGYEGESRIWTGIVPSYVDKHSVKGVRCDVLPPKTWVRFTNGLPPLGGN